jgi:hypothetical protein
VSCVLTPTLSSVFYFVLFAFICILFIPASEVDRAGTTVDPKLAVCSILVAGRLYPTKPHIYPTYSSIFSSNPAHLKHVLAATPANSLAQWS